MGGNDTLIAGYYTTVMDGGDGNDIVDARASQYVVELDGGPGDDVIYGVANGNPIINGGDGNDTITAQGQVHGGAGDNVVHAMSPYFTNNNNIYGDAGNDTIYGSDGADNLNGGSGDDVLTGGAGSDLFVVGDGNDVITDFSAGDKLAIEASFSASAINQVGNNVVITLDSQDHLTFDNMDVAGVKAAIQSSVHINDVKISPDGATIYAAGDDGTLYVYDGKTGDLVRAWHVGNELGGMDISADGSFAIVTDLQPLT